MQVRDGHVALLQRLDGLLSPCMHHCEYLQRWGPPGLQVRTLYAADYHYFHVPTTAGSQTIGAVSGAATGVSRSLPPAMRPWEPSHRYVTLVSPAPEKGLAVLMTLARRLPHVPFAAVTTQWTGAQTLAQLKRLPNITILPAHPDVDVIFRQTRVLLAPSLWQVSTTDDL
jgi:hypothetical protein